MGEEVSTLYTTSCYNGRHSVFSVQTITDSVESVIQTSQDLNDLLSRFLSLSPQSSVARPQASAVEITSTEVTQTITHSSTYITQITETDSTELAVTFRGKPIITTILDTSVKEITATEYSTETRVNTQLVTQTLANTELLQLSALSQSLDPDNLENQ